MVHGVRIKDHWAEQRLFERRALLAGVCIALATLLLIGRLVLLQIVRHDYYTDLSQGNRVRIEPIPAARGLILDRNGEVLAANQPAYQLELVREEVPDLEAALAGLVRIGLLQRADLEDVRRNVKSRRSFDSVPVRLRLTEDDVARFAVRRFEFPGLDIKTRLARSYPYGELGVHALGYVSAVSEQDLARIDRAAYSGTTLIGKLGVESAFEPELHGANGFREVLVNAQGRSVERQGALVQDLRHEAPVAGQDLVLSMDLGVQRIAEAALGANRGAVVAIDPRNGDVLALASKPGFDPSLFGRGLTRTEFDGLQNDIDRPLFNRALRGVYPPGSTIKPIIALAGLVHGIVVPEQTRYCRGFFTLPGSRHRFRDWKPEGHGVVNLERAIAQSCDVYFYGLSDAIGVDRISEFMSHFGFGKPTGLDIGGEKTGLLPSREWKQRAFSRPAEQVWFPGETVIFGIGQGYLLATPLQLAHVAAIVSSRGKSYKPRLVTALRDPASGNLRRIAPALAEDAKVGLPDQWDRIVNGMIAVTHGGTASASARGATYTIAGKTGTAQVFSIAQNEKYDEKKIDERLRDHAWFIAFAPAESPRIAVAVLVENGRSGSGAAAPIARKVMDAWLVDAGGNLKGGAIQTEAAATTVPEAGTT
ncbi:MAG TPA: penicillin-binding protein 2 [Steroidobacteraceae bacterium]|nr:penicillin-binding protein 2 [Steroidobacteraceae bacterium]